MSETLSVTGLVATTPRHLVTQDGLPITSFRLASSQRRFDRNQNKWIDGETNWFTVTAFRQLAINSAGSINKGDRLVVAGKLRVQTGTMANGPVPRLRLKLIPWAMTLLGVVQFLPAPFWCANLSQKTRASQSPSWLALKRNSSPSCWVPSKPRTHPSGLKPTRLPAPYLFTEVRHPHRLCLHF